MKNVYVLGRLKVENYEHWQNGFNEDQFLYAKKAGLKKLMSSVTENNPNEVVILFKWDNMENAQKYFESDFLKKRLKEAGSQITSITYLDEVEKTT